MPFFAAMPAFSSSTKRTGTPGEMTASDNGSPCLIALIVPSCADEDQVERHRRVLHPEADLALVLEHEQHAVVVVHVLAEHQPALAFAGLVGDLDA